MTSVLHKRVALRNNDNPILRHATELTLSIKIPAHGAACPYEHVVVENGSTYSWMVENTTAIHNHRLFYLRVAMDEYIWCQHRINHRRTTNNTTLGYN